jgi:hypothetical protein
VNFPQVTIATILSDLERGEDGYDYALARASVWPTPKVVCCLPRCDGDDAPITKGTPVLIVVVEGDVNAGIFAVAEFRAKPSRVSGAPVGSRVLRAPQGKWLVLAGDENGDGKVFVGSPPDGVHWTTGLVALHEPIAQHLDYLYGLIDVLVGVIDTAHAPAEPASVAVNAYEIAKPSPADLDWARGVLVPAGGNADG